jgi:hypothetical protein
MLQKPTLRLGIPVVILSAAPGDEIFLDLKLSTPLFDLVGGARGLRRPPPGDTPPPLKLLGLRLLVERGSRVFREVPDLDRLIGDEEEESLQSVKKNAVVRAKLLVIMPCSGKAKNLNDGLSVYVHCLNQWSHNTVVQCAPQWAKLKAPSSVWLALFQ